jgi:Domain of unknown function (DUF5063)
MKSDSVVLEFIETGKAYCALIENTSRTVQSVYIQQLALSLSRLYWLALQLPRLEAIHPVTEDSERLTEVERKVITQTCLYPLKNLRSEAFDEYPLWGDSYGAGTLAFLEDDLSDIYFDLKPGLRAFERDPQHLSSALFEWTLLFRAHWGRHATSALGIVNELIANHFDHADLSKVRRAEPSDLQ